MPNMAENKPRTAEQRYVALGQKRNNPNRVYTFRTYPKSGPTIPASPGDTRGFGQNRCAVVPRGNVGATLSSCIFVEVRLRHHGGLLAAAVPYRKGAAHDCSSATND